MITVKVSRKGKKTEDFLNRIKTKSYLKRLGPKYGPIGVTALKAATPVDSSETANAWYFEIINRPGYYSIQWLNSHMESGISIAAIIQYGHATRNGGYVEGLDYINPAMQDIFQSIADDMWKEVTK